MHGRPHARRPIVTLALLSIDLGLLLRAPPRSTH
jgi:hypothetical protein